MTDKLPKIPPSKTITRMEEALADLHARLKAERAKEHQRAELAAFLHKRPALTHRDVLDALTAVGRGKRQRGKEPVLSKQAHAQIGRTIAKAREAKGMTKVAFGDKLGRHNSTVTYWETGKGLPSAELRPKIIKLLGLPKDALSNGDARA